MESSCLGSNLKRIRSGGGLGDSLYLQSIVRQLVSEGENLEVCTNYPELFQLPVRFAEFSRTNIQIIAHYSLRRECKTNQWEDVQINAKVKAELKLDWKVKNPRRLRMIHNDKPILFVNGGRTPMDRKDGFGKELIPKGKVFNEILQELRKDYYAIYCGRGERSFDIEVDLDLLNKTDVREMIDIASVSEAFFGQVSFIVPLAESFDKKLLCVWSEAGLNSHHAVIRTITPQKILSKESSYYVYDSHYDLNQFLNA